MQALSFDYDAKRNESVAHYRGLTIRAVQDSDCSNPLEDSDGFAPALAYSLGNGESDYSGAYDIESPLTASRISDRRLATQWRQLCDALGVDDAAALEAELKAERKEYGGRLADYRRDKLESILAEKKPDGSRAWAAACDYYDALERLWALLGVAALDCQRNGYSQGDSVRLLFVALPEWREAMGIEPSADMESDLKAQADTFGAWAFGDCFGYVIETPDGESLDSCWGFIGDDFEQSGLAEAARETADSILAAANRRRLTKLAELIRARVPVAYRPAILAEAGKLESAYVR